MNQQQMMVQNTIASNAATIISEFQSLHLRQLDMLALLENEFLKAIPEKILDMNVEEFLNKHHGDFNQAYSQLLKKDDYHDVSQESSQASTIGIHGISQQNPKPQPFLTGTILPYAQQHGNANNKSILKTSKRKRNNNYNELDKRNIQNSNDNNNNNINGTFHNGNHYYTHNYQNKENSNDINNNPEKQYPLQSNKNTAKKAQHKEQHQLHSQQQQQQQQHQSSQAVWQSSMSKSGKKIWKI